MIGFQSVWPSVNAIVANRSSACVGSLSRVMADKFGAMRTPHTHEIGIFYGARGMKWFDPELFSVTAMAELVQMGLFVAQQGEELRKQEPPKKLPKRSVYRAKIASSQRKFCALPNARRTVFLEDTLTTEPKTFASRRQPGQKAIRTHTHVFNNPPTTKPEKYAPSPNRAHATIPIDVLVCL